MLLKKIYLYLCYVTPCRLHATLMLKVCFFNPESANLHTFKSVISCHFFYFLCQHGIGRCLNRCHYKSFVSHNVDWNKKIRNSIDSCQIQIIQLIPSANRFQTSRLYRLIIVRKSLLFIILSKDFNSIIHSCTTVMHNFLIIQRMQWVATVFLVALTHIAHPDSSPHAHVSAP